EKLIGAMFADSLEAAVAAGDAVRVGREPMNLFWFAHHALLTAALTRMPSVACLAYGNAADLDRQLCEFLLRGIGLTEAAIDAHLNPDVPSAAALPATVESA
ncbi:MAG: TetR family transcriptional regulator, partial [Bradyrhizobium sp.]|nr:TetR family transcriptional regulator [Bradyrhizobium sp.]